MSATADTASTPHTPATPPASRSVRNRGLALLVIASAQLMIVLDATIVNIALPHLQTDLGFSDAGRQWVVTAYALAFGSLLLLGGRLGDLFGRRRMFISGIGIFAAASLLGGFAPSPFWLIAARVLQGVGAALAAPAALALINTTFPAGKERNRAMAVYAAMSGAGAAIGLILGGALTEIDWRWTFFINVPIGVVVALLAPRVLVESDRQRNRLDLPGAVTGTLGLLGIVYGLSHAAEQGASWGDAATLLPLIGGAALLAAFVVIERRTRHALLPLRIITDRTRGLSLFAFLIIGAAMFAVFFFLGLYIQQVMGYQPIMAGVAFLPFSAGIVTSAMIGQNLVARVDPRWLSGVGALMGAAGMVGFAQLQVDSNYWTHLLPAIVVMALGMGLMFIPLTITATHGVRPEDSGAASAALNTAQQIGGAVGIAALTTVFSHYASRKAGELLPGLLPQLQADYAAAAATGAVPARPSTEQFAGWARAHLPKQASDTIQTFASTAGFWVAAGMLAAGAVLILTLLNVRHRQLQTDGEATVHVG